MTDLDGVIERCRRNFGGPGRWLNWLTWWTYLRVSSPAWLESSDALTDYFDRWKHVLKHGEVGWGYLVQANNLLFRRGDDDCPASVLYCVDPDLGTDVTALGEIVEEVRKLKGTVPQDRSLRRVAHYLTTENTREFGLPVPRLLCEEAPCVISDIIVFRKHLPGRKLTGCPAIPLVYIPDEPGFAAILPERYWPFEFIELWNRIGGMKRK